MSLYDRALETYQRGKTPSKGCLFCQPNEGMCLWETDHFRVLIDTYPIAPGHLMISSKQHFGSAGELPGELHTEYLALKDAVQNFTADLGPGMLFYEHGKAGSCHASSSDEIHCEHFHLHCLPLSVCIHSAVSQIFSGITLTKYEDIFPLFVRYGSYLFFENAEGLMKFYPASEGKVPAHFLRTLLCEKMQIAQLADWQSYGDFNRYLISVERILQAYQAEKQYALS